ncbi:hypothetical protein MACH10_09790 [Thalassospira tepidiphila]|uniref:hypothetical protein n=1 Tax=Thalassospira tepidiphila TaxID=393657 RepID=UPI0029245AB7|nr:hypothetical protein MACH10_09790 [Thalassospira tepidiphila]
MPNFELTGDVVAAANSNQTEISSNAVTYTKMQDVSAAARVIGRGTDGPGDPQELELGVGIEVSGTTIAIPDLYRFHGALVASITPISTISSVNKLIPWNVVEYDTAGFFDVNDPTKLTIPEVFDGKHVRLWACVRWDQFSYSGYRYLEIRKNDSQNFPGSGVDGRAAAVDTNTCQILSTAPIQVASNDYFEVRANQNSGGTLDIFASELTFVPSFGIEVLN